MNTTKLLSSAALVGLLGATSPASALEERTIDPLVSTLSNETTEPVRYIQDWFIVVPGRNGDRILYKTELVLFDLATVGTRILDAQENLGLGQLIPLTGRGYRGKILDKEGLAALRAQGKEPIEYLSALVIPGAPFNHPDQILLLEARATLGEKEPWLEYVVNGDRPASSPR